MNIALAVGISSEPTYSKLMCVFYRGVPYICSNLCFYNKCLKTM